MTHGISTDVRLKGFELHLRSGIAFREYDTADGVLFYLSLYDDEIDDRCERFWRTMENSPDVPIAAESLELTDAVIGRDQKGITTLIRGGSCTFPMFWSGSDRTLRLSTTLPLQQGGKFQVSAFAPVIASLCLPGSFELNAHTETPLVGWRRCRRGYITTFSKDDNLHESPISSGPGETDLPVECLNKATIEGQIRAAFLDYGRSQRRVTSSVLELSGGFDSTLAASTALRCGHTMHGISMEFPYYEFRFEAPVQRAVAESLKITRTAVDGRGVFPYAPWNLAPRFDEPAFFVTGIRHAECVGQLASSHHATKIYMGHGGDHLFASNLRDPETTTAPPTTAAFNSTLRRRVLQAVRYMCEPQWLQRSAGCFVYEARQDVWIKEAFGATIRTPFTDLAVFRAAQAWSLWCTTHKVRPDKTILAAALPDFLPKAVTERKGKVAYDGVWARSYRENAGHIGRTIERASSPLERIGLSPSWILRQIQRLSNWESASEREVLAAYAVAAWFLSWGLERASDAEWDER